MHYDEIVRQLKTRLESLTRAGLDRVPSPRLVARGAIPARRTTESDGRIEPAPVEIARRPAALVEADRDRTDARSETPREIVARPKPAQPIAPRTTATGRTENRTTGLSLNMNLLYGDKGFDEPIVPAEERRERLRILADEIAECRKCPVLVANRSRTVPGDGDPNTRLMFVGEAPGADEDRQGIPFVGRAGALLNDMIVKGMGLRREDVFIANAVKCRPPENRTPEGEEIAACRPFLERQIAIVRPRFICILGKVAATSVLQSALPMNRLRGKWHRYRGIPTIVTYHPAYLLRNPAAKKETWEDLKLLMQAMGLKLPSRGEDS
jgi:DNA polymerase